MRVSAIIVAAGSGARLGLNQPKAFVPVAGRPLLGYSLRTIAAIDEIVEAVVTVPPGMEPAARAEVAAAALHIPVKLTPGGTERQDSVRIALALTSAQSEVVVVHDAARPFATAELFRACIAAAARSGGALAAVPASDTLKRVERATVKGTVPRAGLYNAQTPQAFRRELLIAAHQRAEREAEPATDDIELLERIGASAEIVESLTPNLKITTLSDLQIAEALANLLARR
jgi:2-C-methyl-D-erythritol 4-phosphate cytidylyltransferase